MSADLKSADDANDGVSADIESQDPPAKKKKTLGQKVAEAKEGSGFKDRELIREESQKARRHSQKIADETGIELVSINIEKGEGQSLPSIQIPSIKLGDFPGFDLSSLTLPENLRGKIGFEKLARIEFPEILLADLSLPEFEAFCNLLNNVTVDIFGDLQIPSLRVGDAFPDLDLTAALNLLNLPDGPDLDPLKESLRQFLDDIELPSFRLGDFPGIELPSAPSFPDIDISLPGVDLPALPDLKMSLPKVNLRRIGGILMKLKLLVGFVQCLSFIPTTLRTIPWPDAFTNLSRILSLASIDLFSAFGNLCAFSTGYLQKFVAQMVVLPFAVGISGVAYLVAATVLPRLCAKAARQTTRESLRTRFFELNFLVVYTLYTSVSTSIFRLFDCQEVQGTWYLSADFTVKCFEAEWNAYAAIAIVGIAVYTIGIPLVLFVLLRRNRAHLYADGCPEDELSRHAIVQKKLGAVYKDYEPHSYYFDLVDLLRRLLLTGGLIVLGDASNVQIFLGGMVCACWLCLVIWRRPYGAFWDNALSAVLSFQLLIIILSGMALEIYRLTPSYAQDPYQRAAFGAFMVVASVFVIVSSLFAVFVSVPCVRDRVIAKCSGGKARYTSEE